MDTKRPSRAIPLGRFGLCCRDVSWLAGLEMLISRPTRLGNRCSIRLSYGATKS